MTFARRANWLRRAAWRLVGCRSRTRARVLLTFDDGPHPTHTPAVLERLAAHRLHGAFFLVGKRITDPALVQRIAAEGHFLGNHTHSHERQGWWSGEAEVTRCRELVPGATLFRPPLGRLTPGLWWAARRHKLKIMNWSLDSGDWRCRGPADAAACAAGVLRFARPGDIILFHDDHPWIGPILDIVLPVLAAPPSPCGPDRIAVTSADALV